MKPGWNAGDMVQQYPYWSINVSPGATPEPRSSSVVYKNTFNPLQQETIW